MISIRDFKEKFSRGGLGHGEQQTQPMQAKEWEDLFKGIDKDGDGKINFSEFQEHMLEMLKKEPNFRFETSTEAASTAISFGSGPGTSVVSSAVTSQHTAFKSIKTTSSKSSQKPRFVRGKPKSEFRVRAKPPTARGFEEPDMIQGADTVREIFHKNPDFWTKMQSHIRNMENMQECIDFFNNLEGISNEG